MKRVKKVGTFDFEFVAEIHLQKKSGNHFKIEKGFHDLESAKFWIRKKTSNIAHKLIS